MFFIFCGSERNFAIFFLFFSGYETQAVLLSFRHYHHRYRNFSVLFMHPNISVPPWASQSVLCTLAFHSQIARKLFFLEQFDFGKGLGIHQMDFSWNIWNPSKRHWFCICSCVIYSEYILVELRVSQKEVREKITTLSTSSTGLTFFYLHT